MTLFRNSGVDWLNRLHGAPAIASAPLPEFKALRIVVKSGWETDEEPFWEIFDGLQPHGTTDQ